MDRRVGLSRNNHHGPPLLRKIKGKHVNDSPESYARKTAQAQRKSIMNPESPSTNVAAPPLDSGDESSPEHSKDIKSTWSKSGEVVGNKVEEKTRLQSRPKIRAGKVERGDSSVSSPQSSGTSSSRKRGMEEEEGEESLASSLSLQPSTQKTFGTQHGPFSSQSSSKKLKSNTYGGKTKNHSSSQNKSYTSMKTEPKKEFRAVPDLDPTPVSTPVKSTIKIYGNLESPGKLKSEKVEISNFKIIPPLSSSPSKSPPKPPLDSRLSDDDSDDSDFPELANIESRESKKIRKLVQKKKEKIRDLSPAAKFKSYDIPELTTGKPLNLGLLQKNLEIMDQDTLPKLPDHLVECPMCKEPVEKAYLAEFSFGERMSVSSQSKFCRSHIKRSAKKDWNSKGYPSIDWDDLDSRINKHHQFLRNLLEQNAYSYYHEKMADVLKSSSKSKLTLKSIISSGGSLTPGYYGTRGLRIMSENIMEEFSPQLRNLSKKDDLIFALGVTPYTEMVLVPELTVLLIREDMKVSVTEAREILKDSATVGDLLQEELDDVIVRQIGDEDDSTLY